MFAQEYSERERAADTLALRQTLDTYVTLLQGDPAWLDVVADDIIGISMGRQDYYRNKSQILTLLEKSKKAPAGNAPKVSIEFDNIDIRIFTPVSATINAEIYVISEQDGKESKFGVMQMISAKKENGRWLYVMLSALPLTLSEETIEAYPLAFADEVLAKLKGELQKETFDLMNESFSSGILGTYDKDNRPLYFANDALIDMLGYERDEFNEKFKDDTVQLAYTEDRARIRMLEADSAIHFENRARWTKKDGSPIWVEFRVRKTKDDYSNDIFLSCIIDVTDFVELQIKTATQNKTIMDGVDYASKIQTKLLATARSFAEAFADHAVIWKPRDVVGGDIYWMKSFDEGTVLCVADCTGHGTPGALLTMLVVSALENAVRRPSCHDTAHTLWRVEQRLVDVFNVRGRAGEKVKNGCDIAVFFIAKDKSVTFSAGQMSLFVSNGREVVRYKGQKIYVGEGNIASKDDVKTTYIPADADNKFYIASDGVFDQVGGPRKIQFGYRAFERIILENHSHSQATITDKIWDAFEAHRGEYSQRDDVQLIAFKP
ncbi:MAG: SpoIIE family protein phosphatase [Defluviitaleaceae bacterium]|nr:SpoIIE family protein phosphatase [Defluviitaleaceae bacterium]MCL2239796.1 SpoIIE family protein phosphatase [Defluviitaleaceae bacterium]